MDFTLTLKTLAILALVAAATALIVAGEHPAASVPLSHHTVLN